MKKQYMKKFLSLVCAGMLLLGMTAFPQAAEVDEPVTAAASAAEYREYTFADFGVSDRTVNVGDQAIGTLGSAESLNGAAVSGYVTLGYSATDSAQSFRIGGTDAAPYLGIGLSANGTNQLYLYHYTGDVSGTLLAIAYASKCGLTYKEGVGFEPFHVRMTFDYVAGTSKVKLNVYINDTSVYSGTLANAADTLGCRMFVWAHNAPITVASAVVNNCFDSSTVSQYFDSYYSAESAEAGSFSASNWNDHWTAANGVITRKENDALSDTGNMAMLVLKDRTYKNFEMKLSYYQKAGCNESLILGLGASQKGKFFAEDGCGIAVTGRKLWNNLITLDTADFLSEGWHTVTMTVTGRILRAYIDNSNEVFCAVLPNSYEGGYVYLAAGANASSFKDFSFAPLACGMTDFGDANEDGAVDLGDAVRLKKILQGMEDITVSQQYMDYDNDLRFDDADYSALRQSLLGKQVQKSVTNGFAWGQDVMPIGGYYGPTKEYITDEFFRALQEMGLNVITTTSDYCDYYSSPENCLKALELGDKYGIYTFVRDSYFNFHSKMTEDEIRNRLQIYSEYKNFAGIRLVDEPVTDGYMPYGETDRPLSQYTGMASLLNRINGIAGYINLFPYYKNIPNVTWEGYVGYVQEYMESIEQQKLISFDHYVFDGKDISVYFKNMSLIRDAAQEGNIPFWAFIQAGKSTNSGRNPSEQEFYWNVNTALAMGAKGIQYFPMQQPKTSVVNGLIYADGTKSPYYDYAKTINQKIANIDHILMNCTHEGIIAVGSTAVANTADVSCRLNGTSFRNLTGVTTDRSDGTIIGCFDYNGKTVLYVVNNSTTNSQNIELTFNSNVKLTLCDQNTTDLGTKQTHNIFVDTASAVLLIVD